MPGLSRYVKSFMGVLTAFLLFMTGFIHFKCHQIMIILSRPHTDCYFNISCWNCSRLQLQSVPKSAFRLYAWTKYICRNLCRFYVDNMWIHLFDIRLEKLLHGMCWRWRIWRNYQRWNSTSLPRKNRITKTKRWCQPIYITVYKSYTKTKNTNHSKPAAFCLHKMLNKLCNKGFSFLFGLRREIEV